MVKEYLLSFELIFCILATWICDFYRIMEPTVQGYLYSCELIFCTLAVWKCDFCRVVKLTVQRYLFSCEVIFCILGAWIFDFCRSWTHGSCVPSFVWANFPHFGGLKKRFLPIRETNVSSYLLRVWKFSYFLRPENAILPSREIHVQGSQPSCEQIFRILANWKWHFCRRFLG